MFFNGKVQTSVVRHPGSFIQVVNTKEIDYCLLVFYTDCYSDDVHTGSILCRYCERQYFPADKFSRIKPYVTFSRGYIFTEDCQILLVTLQKPAS